MKAGQYKPIDRSLAQLLLDEVAPGHRFESATPAGAAYTNQVHVLKAVSGRGHGVRIVVKQLTDSRDSRRAIAEYHGLRVAHRHGLPVPEPLLLDADGSVLGVPGLVTGFIAGEQVMSPGSVSAWAEQLADALLTIHAVTPSAAEGSQLYDGEEIGLYFLTGHWPSANAGHPLSAQIYEAIEQFRPELRKTRPRFLHMDFWPGNVLWNRGRIAGVVDWDATAVGDRAIDVGNFRMEMHLRGIREAADIFLRRYEAGAGEVENLAFWDLAAAARPLPKPIAWLLDPPKDRAGRVDESAVLRNYFRFVSEAIARMKEGGR